MTTYTKAAINEKIYVRAIKFIEDNSPKTEPEHKEGNWGESFYAPVEFCDGLTGQLKGAWARAKKI